MSLQKEVDTIDEQTNFVVGPGNDFESQKGQSQQVITPPTLAITPPRSQNLGHRTFRRSSRGNSTADAFPDPNFDLNFKTLYKTPSVRPRTARTVYRPPEHAKMPEPSEAMKGYMNRALKKDPLNNLQSETLTDLIQYLSEERKMHAEKHEYREGQRYNDAISYVRSIIVNMQKKSYQKDAESNAQEIYKEFHSKFEEFDQETNKLIVDLEKKQKEQREALISSQQEEGKKFDAKWTSPYKFRLYNHASYQLTALKQQQTYFLSECRFQEAEALQKEISAREAKEQAMQHEQMQNDYNCASKLLRQKHQTELDLFDQKAALEKTKLQQKRSRLRYAYENQEKKKKEKLEESRDPEKVWSQTTAERIFNTTQRSISVIPVKPKKSDFSKEQLLVLALPPLKLQNSGSPKPKKVISNDVDDL